MRLFRRKEQRTAGETGEGGGRRARRVRKQVGWKTTVAVVVGLIAVLWFTVGEPVGVLGRVAAERVGLATPAPDTTRFLLAQNVPCSLGTEPLLLVLARDPQVGSWAGHAYVAEYGPRTMSSASAGPGGLGQTAASDGCRLLPFGFYPAEHVRTGSENMVTGVRAAVIQDDFGRANVAAAMPMTPEVRETVEQLVATANANGRYLLLKGRGDAAPPAEGANCIGFVLKVAQAVGLRPPPGPDVLNAVPAIAVRGLIAANGDRLRPVPLPIAGAR